MSEPLRVEITDDGSPTLYSTQFNAHYHSTHGAMQESLHVFIKEGLQYFRDRTKVGSLSILEYGMGTGLNALLTWISADVQRLSIDYHAIEGYPINHRISDTLSYLGGNHKDQFDIIHTSPWANPCILSDYFTLTKEEKLFEDFKPQNTFDIIFFDAFAPSCQPHLWGVTILKVAFEALNANGILVTFCVKGSFRRALKSVGFSVDKIPGPPGKREMTRATKTG